MGVKISYSAARQIAEHATAQAPSEACGLLGGRTDHILDTIPVRNAALSPEIHFKLDPEDQLKAMKAIDDANLEWIGVYHSHPHSAPLPSETDIKESIDTELLQLIVSLERSKPQLKLWRVERSSVTPVELQFDSEEESLEDAAPTRKQQVAILVVGIAAVLILLLVSFTLLPPAPEITPVP